MSTVCITGSTDGIGLSAARLLLSAGHRVLIHARSPERGAPVVAGLTGDVDLVVGDLTDLTQIGALADQIGEVDVLVNNAGVWVGGDMPRRSVQGIETTFAVNVLAAQALTMALAGRIRQRLIFLGSGMVGSGHVDPKRLGEQTDAGQAYADSKAADVALALGWATRLPGIVVGAVDPGWVKTKLASAGAPGHVDAGGRRVADAAVDPGWSGGYTAGRGRARLPAELESQELQDGLFVECEKIINTVLPHM